MRLPIVHCVFRKRDGYSAISRLRLLNLFVTEGPTCRAEQAATILVGWCAYLCKFGTYLPFRDTRIFLLSIAEFFGL